VNFVGVTVDVDRPYIHFPSGTHTFAPVAIGDLRCPTQVYELYNGGAVPVHFQLDLSPLGAVKQVPPNQSINQSIKLFYIAPIS